VRAVSLQFKLLCRRINRQYNQNTQKIYSILPQSPTTIPTDYDPSVFHRELQKNYSPCHNQWRQYWRFWPVGISQRVAKQLQPLPQSLTDIPTDILMPTSMNGTHSNAHDCQIVWSVGTVTDGCGKSNACVLWHTVTDGLQKIWRDFQNFGAKLLA